MREAVRDGEVVGRPAVERVGCHSVHLTLRFFELGHGQKFAFGPSRRRVLSGSRSGACDGVAMTVTSAVLGGFRKDPRTRAEAMALITGKP